MSDADAPDALGPNAAQVRALASGDPQKALQILERAVAFDPDNLAAWLNYGGLLRSVSRADEAMAAIGQALRIQPRSFHALLMKGSILDSQGKSADAGRAYGLALMFAPADGDLDPPTLAAVQRARQAYEGYAAALGGQIRAALSAGGASAADRRRFDKFVDIVAGVRPAYEQRPSDFHFPGLPAIEFYDDETFPWIPQFESAFPAILAELQADLARGDEGFAPYVQLPSDVPVDQWAELNHSIKWSSLFLKQNGRVVEKTAPRFRKTLDALAQIPQPIASNRSPVAMFSALQPRTRIPPHHGVTNTRLVLHLPLIVPPDCGFRVGSETRPWVPGKAWVFNDTIEHEAWNDSDARRIILIADIWNPLLSRDEREMYDMLMRAIDEFHDQTEAYSASI